MTHRPLILVLVVLVAGAVAWYWRSGGSIVDTEREIAPVDCDSVQAARLALDSLARLDGFPSEVHRSTRDSAGMRIVTWPEQRRDLVVIDGMAIVHVDSRCRITSLVQTDSA